MYMQTVKEITKKIESKNKEQKCLNQKYPTAQRGRERGGYNQTYDASPTDNDDDDGTGTLESSSVFTPSTATPNVGIAGTAPPPPALFHPSDFSDAALIDNLRTGLELRLPVLPPLIKREGEAGGLEGDADMDVDVDVDVEIVVVVVVVEDVHPELDDEVDVLVVPAIFPLDKTFEGLV